MPPLAIHKKIIGRPKAVRSTRSSQGKRTYRERLMVILNCDKVETGHVLPGISHSQSENEFTHGRKFATKPGRQKFPDTPATPEIYYALDVLTGSLEQWVKTSQTLA